MWVLVARSPIRLVIRICLATRSWAVEEGIITSGEEAVFGEDCDGVYEEDRDCGLFSGASGEVWVVEGRGPWNKPPKEKKSVAIVSACGVQMFLESKVCAAGDNAPSTAGRTKPRA
jgi:hypothetical protein